MMDTRTVQIQMREDQCQHDLASWNELQIETERNHNGPNTRLETNPRLRKESTHIRRRESKKEAQRVHPTILRHKYQQKKSLTKTKTRNKHTTA
jgi:hypothetical protein